MNSPRIRSLVAWPVDPTPLHRRAVGGARSALDLTLGVMGIGGVDAPEVLDDPRLPGDASTPIGTLNLRGDAPWLPEAAGPAGVNVELYRDRAATTPGAAPATPVTVPLSTLSLAGARCRTPRRGRQPDSVWEADLTGADTRLVAVGTWLSLAWAAHLAGWPDPS